MKMQVLKKVISKTKKIDKVIPGIGQLMTSLDILENTSKIIAPIVESARNKNIQTSKRIFAVQEKKLGKVKIGISEVDIWGTGISEEVALDNFIEKLMELEKNKILGNSKKISSKRIKLIEKIKNINEKNDNLRDYIFRKNNQKDDKSLRISNKTEEIWYIAIEGERKGPYSFKFITNLISKKQINIDKTFVWKKGMVDWQLTNENLELTTWMEKNLPSTPPPMP